MTRPFAEDRISEYAGETGIADPEVVTQNPFDEYADVMEYAADMSATDNH